MSCRSSHRPRPIHPLPHRKLLRLCASASSRILSFPHRSRPQTLCSTPCPPASAPRRGRLRDPAPRPKSPLKKKPHRAPGRSHCRPHTPLPETGSFPHSPPRRPKRNDPKAAPQTQKNAPAHCAGAVSDAPRKAERRRENYFAIPFIIAPETPGAAWYSPNE